MSIFLLSEEKQKDLVKGLTDELLATFINAIDKEMNRISSISTNPSYYTKEDRVHLMDLSMFRYKMIEEQEDRQGAQNEI